MAAILNSAMLDSDTAILDSDTLLSSADSLKNTLLWTQTNSIWLKLIHSHSTWWWQPSWILPSWIQTLPSWIQTSQISLRFIEKHSHFTLTLTQTNSFWLTRWWQPSSILPSWIQPFCTKKLSIWHKHFILTQLDDGSHLEFCHVGFRHCHLGFRHLVIFSQIHSKTLSLHSDSDSN